MEKNKLNILINTPSLANHYVAELRDTTIQKDSMRFRRNLERLGELLAYEISKTLPYTTATLTTPLAQTETKLLAEQPVLATILRAGLPLYQGMLNYFDKAYSTFVGAYRVEEENTQLQINMEYLASTNLHDKILILADPMLATGRSLVESYQGMLRHGKPKQVHIAAAIAAPEGLAYVQQKVPEAYIWLGALDDHLNERSYIVPGLGDAGDLAFGPKV
ncbi:uracil phosphoribosyltransferase [Pontibacter ummariensis]|uniref:Uracil phosphoribosyltransferase n=1 Tax=Pontibacter ummariensis TaxID=1610492 RepID=A0A239JLG8_9BACT|nr:uracil phosphoribosyltransferase [Pontibacter ummariensis]PRY07881.1 uracil phosphoribosyltransferase [Pontibacter ummariensis]SNT06741.1 uracil phosphoribosyltransferase [Pontibacter ummariensis]